ncbi:acetyl-CoA C-acyltransferase [Hymenobacter lutimineralis]|uniref:acetyl-CoA C-acetyltransferase n=1 Tax=Hymenobacter lutimineralis TaxID=2606448 RepID=A0A5D6V606_9BACT|nr:MULTISPECIES: acetyl-CoA C-acyltransferase [Hymenobacter]QIX63089.1 acetyl-CoA C-acyltransferase [Hymenobacter sp. BT18]TYZ10582.1 acetyl-CoA C-acyltransferase [Hymenobacter lutimineralis]
MQIKEVVIVAAVRTPIGSFGGSLASLSATELGAIALKGALEKAGVDGQHVQQVIMGNVISANLGQAPARQASKKAGLPDTVECTTVNKVCASGTKAIMMGAQAIMLGQADVVLAGGMESMSNVPYYLDKARFGAKYGHGQMIDGLVRDGLWDPYHDYAMGNAADATAAHYGISREEQDAFARQSYERSAEAAKAGKKKDEIVPVTITVRGKETIISDDEEYTKVDFAKFAGLKPAFTKEGTVTAANASTLNDGAAAVLLMSREKAEELGVKPLARIRGFADAEQAPEWFTTTPSLAIPKALKNAGVEASEVDFYEINEAFSVVSLANNKLLNLEGTKVNVYGGAVSLGHPLGASGARIVTTLVNVLQNEGGKIGVTGICNGGGGASSIVVEKL